MPVAALSSGCLLDIMGGAEIEKPVLQILGSKRIQSTESTERYRLLVSDGKYLNSFAMLATQLNDLVLDGQLMDNTIVRVSRYITSMVNKSEPGQTKRVLIILELDVLNAGSEVGHKVGNPVVLTDGAKPATAPKAEVKPEPSFNANHNHKPASAMSSMNQSINESITHPISSLSPYQNKWVIKVRVTAKSTMRSWNNAKGEGKLFSMDLVDESGEIKATAFKEQAEKYFDLVKVDSVYMITKAQLKPANKQYSKLNNDYEITFTQDTVMQECNDETSSLPTVQFNFKKICDLANLETNTTIDVIGVCRDVADLHRFTAKTSGREMVKREVTLVDDSDTTVSLTLWGEEAENFDGFNNPVLALKGVRVNEFNGSKSISTGYGCNMKINPDIAECHQLRGWFENGGRDKQMSNISTRNTGAGTAAEWVDFADVKGRGLGNSDKPDYFQYKSTITLVRTSGTTFYKACPSGDCNKKVVEVGDKYRCEKCSTEYDNFKYRLLININISDWSSNIWITLFSDHAEQIIGRTSQEVGEVLDLTPDQAEKYMSRISFKSYIFKLRSKVEVFGDSARTKTAAVAISPVVYKDYNEHLVKNLQRFIGIGKEQKA